MLKEIQNQTDYDRYKKRVASFFERENIKVLSDAGKEAFFQHANCECCGRSLAGDRYEMNGLTHSKPFGEEIFQYDVCVDCLYFVEYGQLDDMTMLDHDLA